MSYKNLHSLFNPIFILSLSISVSHHIISASTPSEAPFRGAKTLDFRLVACQKSGNHFAGGNTGIQSVNLSISSTKGRGAQRWLPGTGISKGRKEGDN